MPEGVADADAPVVVAFISTMRTAVVSELGDALATFFWVGAVVIGGLIQAISTATFILPAAGSVVIAGALLLHYFKLRSSGRLTPAAVTVAFDAEGVTYAISGRIAKLPWSQWRRAYRRFGIWHLKLVAAPTKGLAFPDSALEPEQRARLIDLLADQYLLRNGHRS
ncbi:hypothetical protein [Catenulispora sp. GP43]|uniref:hypothetical protein n=1 Tax=Catenulispora sp. GP43 TaxID=3156263 RepID=UPI003517F58D